MPDIHELATLTSKGQVTLPKPIRQALGVDAGGKIAFRLREDGLVVVSRAEEEHQDPAIAAFLDLLAADIQSGQRLQSLPTTWPATCLRSQVVRWTWMTISRAMW